MAEAALDEAMFLAPLSQSDGRLALYRHGLQWRPVVTSAPVTWRLIVNDEYMEIGHGQPSERHANFVRRLLEKAASPRTAGTRFDVRLLRQTDLITATIRVSSTNSQYAGFKMALWIAPDQTRDWKRMLLTKRRLREVWDLPDGEPEGLLNADVARQGSESRLSVGPTGSARKGNIGRSPRSITREESFARRNAARCGESR